MPGTRRGARSLSLMLALLAATASERGQGELMPQDNPPPSPQADGHVSGPETQADGLVVYRVTSPYQQGETLVRVLAPATLELPERRRVLFVLPVEAGLATRWGDPVGAARAAGVAERHGFVALLPTFSHLPWYCDHPTDPVRRQESYVLKVLVPLAERLYPHAASRRALVGYSKSGWGAFSLLLRNPGTFAAAAAWDAPMMMARPMFGIGEIAGTQENFERLRVARLLREHADAVRGAQRLVLMGFGNFRGDTQQAHALMMRLGIPHQFADGPHRQHHWESGWLEEAVKALRELLP